MPFVFLRGDSYSITFSLHLDALAWLMLGLIALIGGAICVYSLAYMRGEKPRYWLYIAGFMAAMSLLVVADNLLMVFMAWELVGTFSYLLIGFWQTETPPARASLQAFLMNRFGDMGFLAALGLLFAQYHTLSLATLQTLIPVGGGSALLGCCLLLAVLSKSAQFPLYSWLPNAMAGPTPASALIHAATMVVAGVYLLARTIVFFPVEIQALVAAVGALTAFLGGWNALFQAELKRMLAYSTISQLGLMVLGMGVGAHDMALLHLFTHAFFKATLFLIAGVWIHAAHSQKIQEIGIFFQKNKHTATQIAFLVAAAALAGVPLLSGFLSKDGILSGALEWAAARGGWAYAVPALGFATSLLTAMYMTRAAWRVGALSFSRPTAALLTISRLEILPIALLAVGCAFPFFSQNPFDANDSWLVRAVHIESFSVHHTWHWVTVGFSLVMLCAGVFWGMRIRQQEMQQPLFLKKIQRFSVFSFEKMTHLAHDFVEKEAAIEEKITQKHPLLHLAMFFTHFDNRAVDGVVNGVSQAVAHGNEELPSIAKLAAWVDTRLVDGAVNALAEGIRRIGGSIRGSETGNIQTSLVLALGGAMAIAALLWAILA